MSDRYVQFVATEDFAPPCLHTSHLFSRGMESNLRSFEERRKVQRGHYRWLFRTTLFPCARPQHITAMKSKRFGFFIGWNVWNSRTSSLNFFIWARTPLLNTDQMLKYVWRATANISRQVLRHMSSSIFKRREDCPESRKRQFRDISMNSLNCGGCRLRMRLRSHDRFRSQRKG